MGNSVARKVLAAMPAVLLIVGTIANLFTVFICMRKNLRVKSTFVFLAFIAVADTIPLYFFSLNDFTKMYFGRFVDQFNEFYCKASLIFYGGFQHASAWLLVVMSFERYAKVDLTVWKRMNFDGKKAAIVSCLVIVALVASFVPSIDSNEFVQVNRTRSNLTEISFTCKRTKIFIVYGHVQLYAYSLIPTALIAIVNILLVKTILYGKSKAIKRSVEHKAKRRSTSISIMAITIAFVALALPKGLISAYFTDVLRSTAGGSITMTCLACLNDLFHSLSFFIFLATNTLFRQEFQSLFCKNSKYSQNITTKSNPVKVVQSTK